MSKFLKNAWYVAAWSDEVTRTPFSRTLLDTPVVFYRRLDGTPVAMHDRCPHRFVPLSRGELVGDEIRCGYHGLTFNDDGLCTDERANAALKERFCLRTFPVVDRYGAMWIWMGDADSARSELIPDFSFFDDPARVIAGRGITHIKANYTLEIDNLLDLSHLDFVHAKSISNGNVTEGEYKAYEKDGSIHSDWWVPKTKAPRQFEELIELASDPRWRAAKETLIVDHWLDMHWDAPGTLYLNVGVAPVGSRRAAPLDVPQGHFVTPETEFSTHYFWGYAMPALGLPEASLAQFFAVVKMAFEDEDRPMIEAQQTMMKSSDFWAESPMILREDTAAVQARRLLDKLIREESAGANLMEEAARVA